jgi:hypothetical protein
MPQKKPDITTYTHFKGSEIFGHEIPDGGTSTACAVAAGCVAATRTKVSQAQTPPQALFTRLRNTARRNSRDGMDMKDLWTPDYGYGVMNPWEAVKDLI